MSEANDYWEARDAFFGLLSDGKTVVDNGLSSSAILVGQALVRHFPEVRPSIRRLVDLTHLSERCVRDKLQELKDGGFIKTKEKHPPPGKPVEYVILCDPGRRCTPAGDAPRQEMPTPPAGDAYPPGRRCRTTPAGGAAKEESKEEIQEESKEEFWKPPSRTPKKQSTLPARWEPNEKHQVLAKELGVDAQDEVEAFKDHHRSKGSKFIDWDAAFRTWLRNAKKFKPNPGNHRRKVVPRQENHGRTGWEGVADAQ